MLQVFKKNEDRIIKEVHEKWLRSLENQKKKEQKEKLEREKSDDRARIRLMREEYDKWISCRPQRQVELQKIQKGSSHNSQEELCLQTRICA